MNQSRIAVLIHRAALKLRTLVGPTTNGPDSVRGRVMCHTKIIHETRMSDRWERSLD